MPQRTYTSLSYTEKPVAEGNYGTNRLPINLVVLHTADGTLNGTLSWFNNSVSGVSSNYVIDTDGKIYAMLEEYLVPYTNGNLDANRRSITIEAIDNNQPQGTRTTALYIAFAKLVADICKFYSIPCTRAYVKGHREVSSSHPQCPGNLDLDRIVREAQAILTPPVVDPIVQIKNIINTSITDTEFRNQCRKILKI